MDGRLEALDGGKWQLRFVRLLPHEPGKVWRALVEPEHMVSWMPARMDGDRRAGAPLRFVFAEEPSYESTGEMRVYDPPRLLEYRWEDEVLRFELRAVDGGCELTFLTRFDEVGKAARDAAGWHVCLDLLEEALAGREPAWRSEDRWKPLSEQYRRAFGPEASRLGPPEWHPESQGQEWSRALAREHSLTIRREFDLPVATAFAAWADPEVMRRWLGIRVDADVRPGGRYRIELELPGGRGIYTGEYVAVEPNQRIVQTIEFGHVDEHPCSEELLEIRFRALDDARTEVALTESWNGPALTADNERGAVAAWNSLLQGMTAIAP